MLLDEESLNLYFGAMVKDIEISSREKWLTTKTLFIYIPSLK